MKAPEGNLSLITSVSAFGALIESTMTKVALRELGTPFGGETILSRLALTSAEVSGVPSWNLTPVRILNV